MGTSYRAEVARGHNFGNAHIPLRNRCHFRGASLPMLKAEFVEDVVVEHPIQQRCVFAFTHFMALIT